MTSTPTFSAWVRRVVRAALAMAFVLGLVLVWHRVPQALGGESDGLGWREPAESPVVLVNAEHPLPKGYQPSKLVPLINVVSVSAADVLVAAEVKEPLSDLFRAAGEAGLNDLYVASAYRDRGEQKELWDKAVDKSYVQKPGRSEHETGLAVDLADLKVGQGGFGASRSGRWLAGNAWRHGFILRYPAGKQAITGIAYEPWHFRYVGKTIARACHRDGLTLEEYLAKGA